MSQKEKLFLVKHEITGKASILTLSEYNNLSTREKAFIRIVKVTTMWGSASNSRCNGNESTNE